MQFREPPVNRGSTEPKDFEVQRHVGDGSPKSALRPGETLPDEPEDASGRGTSGQEGLDLRWGLGLGFRVESAQARMIDLPWVEVGCAQAQVVDDAPPTVAL